MMNLSIVQNHDNISGGIFFQHIGQKGLKYLRVIGFMVFDINLPCFIVQNPQRVCQDIYVSKSKRNIQFRGIYRIDI